MSRWPAILLGLAIAVTAALVLFGSGPSGPQAETMVDPPKTEDSTMNQIRSPALEQSLAAFAAAGAEDILPVLTAISEGLVDLGPVLTDVPPEALARVYARVPTRHAGDQSSALVFALDAGSLQALSQMIAAGADPQLAGGLFAQVAVRHYTGSLLNRDWSLSVAALDLYLAEGGNPTFASPDDNLPLFVIALQNGNLPGAVRLLQGGADIWAKTRRQGQKPAAVVAMDYWPATIEFMAIAAEAGAFVESPPGALAQIIGFYAEGYLDDSRTGPDRSFPHAGTAGMRPEPDKAALVIRLLRALQPLASDNPDLVLALGIAETEGR